MSRSLKGRSTSTRCPARLEASSVLRGFHSTASGYPSYRVNPAGHGTNQGAPGTASPANGYIAAGLLTPWPIVQTGKVIVELHMRPQRARLQPTEDC